MGLENFSVGTSETPGFEKSENIFMAEAERANPNLETLKLQLAQLTQKIGTVKQMMGKGEYPGKLTDLNDLIAQKDGLVELLNRQQDKPQSGFDGLSGSRQETIFRKTN